MTGTLSASRTTAIAAIVALLALAGVGVYFLAERGSFTGTTPARSSTTCLTPSGISRTQLQAMEFGPVREFSLPAPLRWSNAITAVGDGSVWFGEQAVPGLGHLFGNGTLLEYPWPYGGRAACGYKTGIWGVLLWEGKVWGTNADQNLLVGIDPKTGTATVVNLTSDAQQPYTLALGPDGDLWFTSLSPGAKLGKIGPDLTVSVMQVSGLKGELPVQVFFVNSSLAYFVAIDPFTPYGHLYSFDPSAAGKVINPLTVGGSFSLLEPSSVSASGGRVWVTQHGASSVASFQVSDGTWTVYPTSVVNFTYTTLPYFVEAGTRSVWFNEHYANRIGLLNLSDWTLTEFSEANPPVENGSNIGNDLTIARDSGGVWFTSTTGNYVGFVSEDHPLPFEVQVGGPNEGSLSPGQTISFNVTVRGEWNRTLQFAASDSENYSSVPRLLRINPSLRSMAAGSGEQVIKVEVTELSGLKPGRYTLALSLTDGLVTRSVYYFLSAH